MSVSYWLLIFILCGACGFLLKCPPTSQRQMRAKVLCPNPATYLCLYDDINGGFSENCSRVTLEQPGKVTTLNYNGNFDNRPCSTNLYQPRYIPYWTNVSTDCIYQKSSCIEEGQAEYQDGGLNSDRTCTCDHSKGYTFVRTPQNPCFCKPLTEDCSCYNAKLLNTSYIWSSDGQCESLLPVLGNEQPSRDSSKATTTQLPNSHLKVESFRYDTVVLVILSILLYFFSTLVECCCCKLDQFANRYMFAALVIRPLPEIIERFEGESCSLECELSSPGAACLKDNYENTRRWQITKTQTGYTYKLKINQVTTKDNARYTLRNENGHVISQTVIDCRQMPKEILKMPKKDRDAFLKAVDEGGRASRLFIRIMLVGKSGAGKTSLLKRLLEDDVDINKIQSTDGVNIEIRKCRINLQTKEWIYSLEPNKTIQELLTADTTNIAYCGFWDFAGQKEFYATHQTFLTPNAIYLLVVDLSEDFKGKTVEKNIEGDAASMGDYIDFWIDNIHCYVVDKPSTDNTYVRPPIVVVGTFIDKIDEAHVGNVLTEFAEYLDTFIPPDSEKRHHIIGVFLVSNADPEMKQSRHLTIKNEITKFAKTLKHETLPVQWILMEKVLSQISMSGNKVISYEEVKKIAEDKHMSSDQADVDSFLCYEHEIGNIIFFADVKDHIILDHQWLVDAFKCLVTSDEFIFLKETKTSVKHGKYQIELIQRLLKKCPQHCFAEKSEFLINMFEKFDIFVRPQTSTNESYYYMPCMMSAKLPETIWGNLGGRDNRNIRSSWLCMELEFLPPALFNHVLVAYIRQYKLSETQPLLKNMGVFYIKDNGMYKLVLCKSLNTIALQVLEYKQNRMCYSQCRNDLIFTVKTVFMRYGMRLRYRLKLLCSEGSLYEKEGKCDVPTIKKFIGDKSDKMYYCGGHTTNGEHTTNHDASPLYNSWFGNNYPQPTFLKCLAKNDEQPQYTCEFCSSQRDYRCDNCQQDMCCECFDKHQPSDKEKSHSVIIYDKFVLDRTLAVTFFSIIDMVVLSNGLILLVDEIGNSFTYDIDGGNRKIKPLHINTFSRPVSLTVIDNNNVAVSSRTEVLIVDVRRQHIIRNISLKPYCLGIMCIDNMLYIGRIVSDSWTIQVLDISEFKVQKTIPLSYSPRCLRYGNNGRIYCLTDSRVIVIYDLNWNVLFTLEELNIPKKLSNITVDNDGNALVLSLNFNKSVIKISPNGKAFPVVSLTKYLTDRSSYCLCFKAKNRKLLQGYGKTISIYKMQK